MSQTNVQTFSGDVEITGGLSVTGTVISTVGTDKVQLTTTSASETDYIPVSKGATGAQALYTDSNLTYNPSTNQIAANLSGNVTGNVSGNLTGNVSGNIAGSADTVAFTARNATANTDYIAFVDTATAGDKALFTDSNLTYNSSTNTIGANITGNAAFATNATFAASATNAGYAASAGSASTATFATTATSATNANAANAVAFTARNATDNTDYIAFVNDAAAGDKALFTDTNLTYNSSTNTIGANITGNAAYAANAGYANSAGSASTATFATNATNANAANAVAFTDRDTNDETDYIAFVSSHTAGDKALYTDSNLTYNPSTNTIGANITGNAAFATDATYATSAGSAGSATNAGYAASAGSASTATFATNATNANAANAVAFTARNATDDTDYIAFVNNATAGDKALYTDSNLTYNSSTNQIAANLSGNVSGTNVSATTLHYPTQTIQPVLNGGGTVTYNASSYIKWSERVIAIPIESNEMGASGYIDIETPVSGTITYFSGSSGSTTATCTAAGVPMGAWQALYYVVTPGQASGTDQTRFRLVNYQNSSWNPDSNWILICVRNGDDQQLKWLPGQTILAPGQSYDSATRGTYGAVFADSATSATKLTTARTIGGVSFDGTANINLPGVNAAGTQNTTGSAAKLTTARTIGGVSFDGSANINLPGVNAAGTQNTTGSAAKLTTARTIGGVSFDGSANIDLPGVNTDGTQNTTGSAATLTTSRTINGVDFNGSGDIIVEPYISNDDTGDTNCPIVFTQNTTAGYKRLYEDSALYFDNTNNRLYSTQMSLGDYFYHTNDSNTYFGFPANDTYSIGTSGVERFRVDSGGDVGIGTNNPVYKLDVNGTVNTGALTATSATVPNDGDFVMGGKPLTSASGLHWDRVNSRLGVGTNAPAYTLDVTGTARFTGAITGNLSGNVTGNVSGSAASATNASSAGSADTVAFTVRNSNSTDYIAFVDTSTAGDKALYTDSNLTYNSSTNTIGANLSGNVTGNLTGNVTGNVSGNAGYATTAGTITDQANSATITASASAGNDTIVQRTSAGYIYANYFNTTPSDVTSGVTRVCVETGDDGFIRHGTSDAIKEFAGLKGTAIAIGYQAARTGQGTYSTALGAYAGEVDQDRNSTAVGPFSGQANQGSYSIALGYAVGQNSQGEFSTALGSYAGNDSQGSYAIAIGRFAGQTNQGSYAVAMGYGAGGFNQHIKSIALNGTGATLNTNVASAFFVKPLRNTGGTAMYYDTSSGEISYSSSDDRMKVKEVRIKDATTTLMKLSPQSYFKKFKLDEPDISHYESGLMAQDVWYDAPELRHTVHLGAYADPTPEKPPQPVPGDIEQDPDYSAWGSDPAQVQYDQLIPYTIKSIQEIVTELPRSKTTVSNAWGQNIVGLVVSANSNTHKTGATPRVTLSSTFMDKKWYGVISDKTTDTNDYDTLVDTKGDTQIWVTDVGGPLESGDLVTTSNVAPGFTQKQGDGALMNYTVAKVTQDCDFTEPTQRAIKVPKRELSNVTFYLQKAEVVVDLYEYEQNLCERRKTMKTETVYRKVHAEGRDTIYFDADGNEVSKRKYETLTGGSMVTYSDVSIDEYNALTPEEHTDYTETQKNVYYRVDIVESPVELEEGAYDETEVRQELVDVLDDNGQIVWEETGETEPVYTLVDHGTYKAALVSAKLV